MYCKYLYILYIIIKMYAFISYWKIDIDFIENKVLLPSFIYMKCYIIKMLFGTYKIYKSSFQHHIYDIKPYFFMLHDF
jgi:hypothetical protein